jgi:hypothetical protein
MNFRIAAVLATLIGLAVGWYFLDDLMTTQAWASHNGKQWMMEAEGWRTLFHAWPVAVGGALFGGFISLVFLGAILSTAEDKDHEQTVNRLTQAKEQAESAAASAEERAQAQFKDKYTEIQNKQQKFEELGKRLDVFARNCQTKVDQANERVEQAEKRASDAEQRKSNAAGAAERRKRKFQRLQQTVDTNE